MKIWRVILGMREIWEVSIRITLTNTNHKQTPNKDGTLARIQYNLCTNFSILYCQVQGGRNQFKNQSSAESESLLIKKCCTHQDIKELAVVCQTHQNAKELACNDESRITLKSSKSWETVHILRVPNSCKIWSFSLPSSLYKIL